MAGVASPAFKTGRYSKYLPDRLAARYAEAQDDPQLLELHAEVALLDARLADLLVRVDTGEAGGAWRAAREAWHELDAVWGDMGADTAHAALGRILSAGAADFAIWADIQGTIEQRRRLVESERKRLVEQQQTITVERALLLVGAIGNIIQRHVTDRSQLTAIANEIGALLGPPSRGAISAGGSDGPTDS